jgi:hypothetical protein
MAAIASIAELNADSQCVQTWYMSLIHPWLFAVSGPERRFILEHLGLICPLQSIEVQQRFIDEHVQTYDDAKQFICCGIAKLVSDYMISSVCVYCWFLKIGKSHINAMD